jgi:hypothetical protein
LRSETDHVLLKLGISTPPAFTLPGSALLILAAGVFVAARLWHLNAFDLWADEITTLEAVRADWHGLFTFVKADLVHPPFFYLLLKLWIAIGGESSLWLRLFPALIAIATIVPFYFLCRELNLPASQIGLALLFAAINGYLIHYAQELRMYSLLLFLTACSLWRFARFCNSVSRTNLVALFVVNLLLVYTHYFGWIVVGVEFVFSILRWHRQGYLFSLSLAVVILCFSPWLYAVRQAAMQQGGLGSNLSWIRQPRLLDLMWPYAILNGPLPWDWPPRVAFVGILLFGYPIVLWMLRTLGTRERDENEKIAFWWLLLSCGLPVIVAWSASQILTYPVWHPRYLIIVAVPYFILVGAAMSRLRPPWLRTSTALLLIGWAALSGLREIENTERVAWQSLMRRMIEAEPTSDRRVTIYTVGSHTIQFYLDEVKDKRFQVMRLRNREDHGPLGDYFWISFRSASDRYRLPFFDAVAWEERKLGDLQRRLTTMGYEIGEGFEAGSPGYRHLLFPVQRRSGRASSGWLKLFEPHYLPSSRLVSLATLWERPTDRRTLSRTKASRRRSRSSAPVR